MAYLEDMMNPLTHEVLTKKYIKENEGYDDTIYLDTKNLSTTGYGFNLAAPHVRAFIPQDVLDKKRKLTKPEGEEIFNNLYTQAVDDAVNFVGQKSFDNLTPQQQTVLIDMSYNMGATKLRKFEKMRDAIQANKFDVAGKEMMDSKYAREDVPNRAKKNFQTFVGSEYSPRVESLSSFGQAFKDAKNAGKTTFDFEGKKYTTEVK